MKKNIQNIFSTIEKLTANNKKQSVELIAVSKKKSTSEILEALSLGINNFGENYLQESLQKISELKNKNIIWHFIGKVQSNKCKDIAENFEWVHTLDRLKIAKKLNEYTPSGKKLKVLIQVNLDNDENKGGIKKENLEELMKNITKFKNLEFRGLMIMPSVNAKKEELRLIYEEAYSLTNSMEVKEHNLELSMGMTNDFKIAIEEGSSMIRIGTGIFGER
tara:strand:+ start:1677 stop:2336 length:660 start_codon:yes stop_codon:yes gene_type:complete